jgi:hypothetical protein
VRFLSIFTIAQGNQEIIKKKPDSCSFSIFFWGNGWKFHTQIRLPEKNLGTKKRQKSSRFGESSELSQGITRLHLNGVSQSELFLVISSGREDLIGKQS